MESDSRKREVQSTMGCEYLSLLLPRISEILIFSQVLEDSDPEKDAQLLKHVEAYPKEQEPLVDSAISFGGESRTIPLPQRTFIPIGHICLGRGPTNYEAFGLAENEEGLYWISYFYISRALQGSGLGRAAMDTIENLAISEPLCAKTLGLNAISKDDPEREEKYKALGLTIPPASVSGLKRECTNSV
jgi:GNAT superfamily N-acetyltransferase